MCVYTFKRDSRTAEGSDRSPSPSSNNPSAHASLQGTADIHIHMYVYTFKCGVAACIVMLTKDAF